MRIDTTAISCQCRPMLFCFAFRVVFFPVIFVSVTRVHLGYSVASTAYGPQHVSDMFVGGVMVIIYFCVLLLPRGAGDCMVGWSPTRQECFQQLWCVRTCGLHTFSRNSNIAHRVDTCERPAAAVEPFLYFSLSRVCRYATGRYRGPCIRGKQWCPLLPLCSAEC